jgi:hypothetical protein
MHTLTNTKHYCLQFTNYSQIRYPMWLLTEDRAFLLILFFPA